MHHMLNSHYYRIERIRRKIFTLFCIGQTAFEVLCGVLGGKYFDKQMQIQRKVSRMIRGF